jgi:hypothetical protein
MTMRLTISMVEGRRRRTGERRRPERRWRRRPARRWRRIKALRISELGGSSPPRVVQSLFLLQPASCYLLLNGFDAVNIRWTYMILYRLNN